MSSRRESSRAAIAQVARGLGDDRSRVVFVGGTAVALYPLEHGADVRPTLDVDAVIDVATTAEYYTLVERLRARGLQECTDDGAPLCRRVYGDIRVDIRLPRARELARTLILNLPESTAADGSLNGPATEPWTTARAAARGYGILPDDAGV